MGHLWWGKDNHLIFKLPSPHYFFTFWTFYAKQGFIYRYRRNSKLSVPEQNRSIISAKEDIFLWRRGQKDIDFLDFPPSDTYSRRYTVSHMDDEEAYFWSRIMHQLDEEFSTPRNNPWSFFPHYLEGEKKNLLRDPFLSSDNEDFLNLFRKELSSTERENFPIPYAPRDFLAHIYIRSKAPIKELLDDPIFSPENVDFLNMDLREFFPIKSDCNLFLFYLRSFIDAKLKEIPRSQKNTPLSLLLKFLSNKLTYIPL
jgi:hypothetical protein